MNDNEANAIIAEFMGESLRVHCGDVYGVGTCKACDEYDGLPYTESLDALVPVWERLKGVDVLMTEYIMPILPNGEKYNCFLLKNPRNGRAYRGEGLTIQQASAHATSKAILELSNEK